MRWIAVIGLVFIVISCNQNYLGTGHAVRNALTLPLDGLRAVGGLITGENHRNYRRRTLEDSSETGSSLETLNLCSESSDVSIGSGDLTEMVTGITNTLCSCRAWGDCPAPTCPCDTLCPDHYGIFQRAESAPEREPLYENSLAFRNERAVFADSRFPMTQGYCWGHTATTQRLNRLGFFKPDAAPPFPAGSREWASFYKEILDDIHQNKVREIPGFSSIREFSEHPVIQEYLLSDIIPNAWAQNAMSYHGLRSVMNVGQSMEVGDSQEFIADVRERIERFHVTPTIVFAKKDSTFVSHAVSVYSVTEKNGEIVLCLNDSNYSALQNSECESSLLIKEDGSAHYSGWVGEEATNLSVPSHDNADMMSQVRSLRSYCQHQSSCP